MRQPQSDVAPDRPAGVVTLLFTDIEGSTKLIRTLPGPVSIEVYERHHRVLRGAFRRHGGYEQRTEGDSFFMVFQDATDAVAAAVDAQCDLAAETWPPGVPVRVRIGIHTGEPTRVDDEYFGLDVHRAARIASAAHGGQTVISLAARDAAALPGGVTLKDLGEHRLKDLEQPEWLFQLVIDGQVADFPPLNSLETPSNLPADVTSLVGRDEEVAEVEALLSRPDVRLVTVTGPGGTGKTRLALAVARRLTESFRNGLVFVDLSAVVDPSDVASAIERALDLPSATGTRPLEHVVTSLRNRAVLLVLDNFEHVAAAARDVSELLAGTRRVKVVATSRSPLRIGAEREYVLEPLADEGAIALFADRAGSVRSGFGLTPDNTGVVAAICERVDRLPLAVELAAARVRALTPEQILARLGSSLGLLVGGAHDLPARQKTLRDTIAWSYELLPADAAAMLRRVAVFSGGATLEALESASDGDPQTLANVEVLLDHSLLRRDAGTDRFQLLSTIREFASEQATHRGEISAISERHAEYFAGLVATADAGLRGPDQSAWLKRLDVEQANLRAALDWTLRPESHRPDLGVRLAADLGWYWYMHGRAVEGSEWLHRAHAFAAGEPVALRAKLAQRLGVLLDQRADKAEAAKVLRESVELYRADRDLAGEASALNSLASALRGAGPSSESRELYTRSLEIRTELGDQAGVSVTTHNLAALAMDEGDYQTARRLCERSRDIEQGLGDAWGAAIASLGVAAAAIELGDVGAAGRQLRDALGVFVELEDDDHVAEALTVLAGEACALGQLERSARLAGGAQALWDRSNLPLSPADVVHVEKQRSTARQALGDEAFAAAFDQGRSMTTEQAVAYALEQAPREP